MKVSIKIKKLYSDTVLPKYAHDGDAGMDVYSREDCLLKAGERHLFKLGFGLELPPGYVSLMWDKSGLAVNHGIKNMGGVIEHTYRGEYGVILCNLSDTDYQIRKGDRISQLLIQPIMTAELEEVDELSESNRGQGGFGSTGKN